MKPFAVQVARARAFVQKAAVSALGIRDVFTWLREPGAGAWQKGFTVDPIGTVVSFGAVFACISRIANDIAKLQPVLLFEDPKTGIKSKAFASYVQWATLRKPNPFQTWQQFIVHWLTMKLLFGNVYVLKVRGDAAAMRSMYVLDSRRVTPLVTPEGDVYYSLGGDNLSRVIPGMVVPASEIIHDRGVTLWHPLCGVSPIYACGAAATQGLRMQTNSSAFFENMSRPSGMLTAPDTIDDITAARLKKEWETNYSASNLGRLAVLGDGLEYKPMTIPAVDAQLVEQLGWTVQDVARCFDMPLYKIASGPVPTAGNVEALELQYYSGCLQTHIEAIEGLMTAGLEMPPYLTVELELDGLLRMDKASQITMLSAAVGGAIMMPDEARAKLNLGPVAGGDQVYAQQQNFSLAALAKRDAREDPFGTAKAPAAPTPAPAPASADPAAAEAAAKAAEAQRSADAATAQVRDLLARLEVIERGAVPVTLEASDLFDDEAIADGERAFMKSLGLEEVTHV